MKRLVRGLAVALATAVAVPQPAFAHGGTDQAGYSNYRTTVTAVTPAVPGLRVEITDVTGGVRLTYTGTEPLYVPGYNGDAYLRLGPDGVFANLNSPATYVNLQNDADVPVPDTATSDATPNWHLLSTGRSVLWHDHRLHWMGSAPPDIVQADPGSTHVVNPEWTIPLLLGQTPAVVTGQLLWEPSPNRTLWLLVALAVFVIGVLLLQFVPRWLPIAVVIMVSGLVANLIIAVGRVRVAHGGGGRAVGTFALAAIIAAGAVVTVWSGRRRAARLSPWLALPGAALLAGGIGYFAMLRFSQLHSDVDATINRLAVVVELGAGAALVAAVLIDRFAPAAVIDSVPAADG